MKTDYYMDEETGEKVKKIRKIKYGVHRPKQFGDPIEKWAIGSGSNGYARFYGHNLPGYRNRSHAEALNAAERTIG